MFTNSGARDVSAVMFTDLKFLSMSGAGVKGTDDSGLTKYAAGYSASASTQVYGLPQSEQQALLDPLAEQRIQTTVRH